MRLVIKQAAAGFARRRLSAHTETLLVKTTTFYEKTYPTARIDVKNTDKKVDKMDETAKAGRAKASVCANPLANRPPFSLRAAVFYSAVKLRSF